MIVTHNLQQAFRVADHVAFMYLGELVEYGPAEQVFGAPRASARASTSAGRSGERRGRSRSRRCSRSPRSACCPRCESTQEKSARLGARREEALAGRRACRRRSRAPT